MEHLQMNEIYEATIRCDGAFDYSISKIQSGQHALREFQQRLWAWATNAGALAEPCLSLDARLLSHAKLRNMILTLLDLIQDNLQAAVDFDSNLSSEGASSSSATEEVPYFTLSIDMDSQGLEAAIQRLDLVASLIDHSSRKGRQRRLEALNQNTVADPSVSFITDGISGQVVMKLARSVLYRKQRITYMKYRKQARQDPRLHEAKVQSERPHMLNVRSAADGSQQQLDPDLRLKPSLQARQVPSEWLRPTTMDGESFARGQLSLFGPSSDSRKTYSVWTKAIVYPKAPESSSTSGSETVTGHAPCPFCHNMFPYQRYKDSKWWR
ncbi:serine/threonine protein kinase [Colletotrichum costaricense]|uniref:Serine/threonine protein kinase n=2 Tax=Colletotrichum acutatum species complex TaxID=2707335 RepID=A0AAJ0E282_9PEZI|nr:serine/threonine protein kinase [Colletotrichum costaricense]XP_060376114.1 serine/threonine protein kinase [Colletotrichum tamarilloi]KAK1483656.1 serine/threonine protein kinase [Colletotrichum tamarilloi]KAK1528600.1 serine/threonine protein kinase [Colletotrichum costaricense]